MHIVLVSYRSRIQQAQLFQKYSALIDWLGGLVRERTAGNLTGNTEEILIY